MFVLSTADVIEAILPFIIFGLIFGFKILTTIAKKVKENGQPHRKPDEDLWEPQTREAPEAPAVPQRSKRQRRGHGLSVPEETHPEGISAEAAGAVMVNERSDDAFEKAQDRAYDLELSDAPMGSDAAFSLNRKKKRKKKRAKVNLNSGKQLRTAIITREIMARPRCFDI